MSKKSLFILGFVKVEILDIDLYYHLVFRNKMLVRNLIFETKSAVFKKIERYPKVKRLVWELQWRLFRQCGTPDLGHFPIFGRESYWVVTRENKRKSWHQCQVCGEKRVVEKNLSSGKHYNPDRVHSVWEAPDGTLVPFNEGGKEINPVHAKYTKRKWQKPL